MARLLKKYGGCSVVEATSEHVERIYPFLRKVDKLEVACMGHQPRQSMLRALESDDVTLTALDDEDVPFAMFGVGQVDGMAYIWCLGTEAVEDNAYQFIRASKEWTQRLTKPYGVTFNFVHKENEVAIKWLKHCGALFLNETKFSSQPFYEFVILAK